MSEENQVSQVVHTSSHKGIREVPQAKYPPPV